MLNEDEHDMILKIFDFSERQVGQVMTPRPRVQAVPHDISPDDLLTRFPSLKKSIKRMPPSLV